MQVKHWCTRRACFHGILFFLLLFSIFCYFLFTNLLPRVRVYRGKTVICICISQCYWLQLPYISFTRFVPNLVQTKCKCYFIYLLMCLFRFQLGFFFCFLCLLCRCLFSYEIIQKLFLIIVSVIHSTVIALLYHLGMREVLYKPTQRYYDLDINFIKHQGSKNNVKWKGEFILPVAHLPKCTLFACQNFAQALFSISLWTAVK